MSLFVFVGTCEWVVQTVNVCSGYLNSDGNENRHACSGNVKKTSERSFSCPAEHTELEKNSKLML